MRVHILTLLICVFAAAFGARACAETYTLLPGQEGNIWGAHAGDTIILKGTYPYLRVTQKNWDPPVTIDATEATLNGGWYWMDIKGLVIKGGTLGGFRIDRPTNVTFDGSKLTGTLLLGGGSNLTVKNISADGLSMGISISKSTDVHLEGISCTRMTGDCIQMPGVKRATIRQVSVRDSVPSAGAHPDAFQTYTVDGIVPEDISLEGFIIYGNTQGIFLGMGKNYSVHDVEAQTGFVHAVSFEKGSTAEMSNVAVSTYPGSPYQARITTTDSDVKVTGPVTVAAYGGSPGYTYPITSPPVTEPPPVTVDPPPIVVDPPPIVVDPPPIECPPDQRSLVAELQDRIESQGFTIKDMAAFEDKVHELAKLARKAKAKNAYIDQILALYDAR